jgi:hypothetical protein
MTMDPYKKPFSEPMTAQAVDGEVVVLGPDSVGVALTPDAAEESARRLVEAAQRARTQSRKA